MMKDLGNGKGLLVEMVAATLEDLKPPRGLALDPMPGRDASPDVYQEWVKRHTIFQKDKSAKSETFYIGDPIYNYYTARAVLNGMPFNIRNESYTLQTALLQLGINDPESVIESWRRDTSLAVKAGKNLMGLLDGSVVEWENDTQIPDRILHDDEDDGFGMRLPHADAQADHSRSLQSLDC
jgi:hypothetical protein